LTTQLDLARGTDRPTGAPTRPRPTEPRDRERAVYVASTRSDSVRLYREAAKAQAAIGYVPVSAEWAAGDGLQLLTVTYLLDPARAAGPKRLPMPAGSEPAQEAEPSPAAESEPAASSGYSRPTLVAVGVGLVAVVVALVRTLLH